MRILMMTTDDPKLQALLREAIATREQQDAELTNWQIETFKFLITSGRIEEHETLEGLRNLLEQVKRTHGGSLPSTPLLDDAASSGNRDENPRDGGEAKAK